MLYSNIADTSVYCKAARSGDNGDMDKHADIYTAKPFPEALGDLLRERHGDLMGRFSLKAFLEQIEGWGYEGMRQMVCGERTLKPEFIEQVAKALQIDPSFFIEYRMHQICEAVKAHPVLVGLFYEQVMSEVAALGEQPQSANQHSEETSPDATEE